MHWRSSDDAARRLTGPHRVIRSGCRLTFGLTSSARVRVRRCAVETIAVRPGAAVGGCSLGPFVLADDRERSANHWRGRPDPREAREAVAAVQGDHQAGGENTEQHHAGSSCSTSGPLSAPHSTQRSKTSADVKSIVAPLPSAPRNPVDGACRRQRWVPRRLTSNQSLVNTCFISPIDKVLWSRELASDRVPGLRPGA